MDKHITSTQHPLIKYGVKLRKERAFRRKEQKALILGSTLIQELLNAQVPMEAVFSIKPFPSHKHIGSSYAVSDIVLEKLTEGSSDSAAILSLPASQDVSSSSYLLVLDKVADPGNLGTLFRSAYALGWDGVFLIEGCCDPFAEKALRAAKGATFLLPFQEGSWEQFVSISSNFHTLVADMEGTSLAQSSPHSPLALIISKETEGARQDAKDRFTRICIPMHKRAESLNAAAAGSILLYHLRK